MAAGKTSAKSMLTMGNRIHKKSLVSSVLVSDCEGSMHHKGQEDSSRKLAWVEGQDVAGWGCCECAWVFYPTDLPNAKSLDELTNHLQRLLEEEFASHNCAEHSQSEAAAS